MHLNISKCFVISFYRKKSSISFDYSLQHNTITRTEQIKDLGITLDCKLRFDLHINNITNKGLKLLGFIKRTLKDFKSIDCFKTVYCSIVRSVLEYASQIWSPHYAVYIEQVEKVQKKFLRFIAFKQGIPQDQVIYNEIAASINLPSLSARRTYLDLIFLYKIINSLFDVPELLSLVGLSVPQRVFREHGLLAVNYHRTNYGYNSPITRMCREMNSIASEVDVFNMKIDKFKRTIKQIL